MDDDTYVWFNCACGVHAGRFIRDDGSKPTKCWHCERAVDHEVALRLLRQVFPDGLA